MKILYLHQYFNTPEKGGGIRSYAFSRRFVEKGYKVIMLTKQLKNSSPFKKGVRYTKIDDIDVYEVPVVYFSDMSFKKRMKSFLLFAWKAIKEGRKLEKPDIIFATSTPLTIGIPALYLSWYFKVPFVFEVRDLWPEAPIQMGAIRNKFVIFLLRKFEKKIYKKAAHIVALSPGMKEGIRKTGVSEEKISMIPNSSDLDIFHPDIPHDEIYEKNSIPRKNIISYAGKINEANGVNIIIEVAKHLQEREDILLVLAGEGRYKEEIQENAERLGLKNLKFLGPIPKDGVAQLYGLSKGCLVLFKNIPILKTNSPNKFFDALAAGRPVITNMGGWVGDLIEKYGIGFSIDNNKENQESVEIAKAIEALVDNPDKTKKMGHNARELAEQEFDRDKLFAQLEKVISGTVR